MDESQKNVNFGALRIGQTAHRTIKLINRSKCDATISLQKSVWKLKNYSLSFTPNGGEQVLKPKQVRIKTNKKKKTKRERLFNSF
jgi:hypothetical protein